MNSTEHVCRYRVIRKEREWRVTGVLREREIESSRECADCGREPKARFRRVTAVEREAAVPLDSPDFGVRKLARKLFLRFQDRDVLRAQPLIRQMGGIAAESDVERLASYGGIRLVYQPSQGTLHLKSIRVLDRNLLAEVAEPGSARLRQKALAGARRELERVQHPQAEAIAECIRSDTAEKLHLQTIRALAALARMVEAGDVMPARVFSTSVLGHSKALAAIRGKLERMIGPLDRLGIRDAGQTVVMGGHGRLSFPRSSLDLADFRHVGVSHHDALEIDRVQFPPGGLLVVENFTPFEACLDLIAGQQQLMLLWSAGFPGKGVLRVIQEAAESHVPIRLWCDLDLGGVRIVRSILRVAPAAQPVLMDAATLTSAKTKNAVTPDHLAAVRRDLTLHPNAPLADLLRAIESANVWVEQEALIDRMSSFAV